jgi:hypothetical protein
MENKEGAKKQFYKRWWFWAGSVVLLFIILASIGSSSTPATSVPAPAESGSSVAAQQAPPAQAATAPQVLLDLTGSGSKTTAKFTAAHDWDLNWSYDCSNFGYQGNFQVFVYSGDGSMSLGNAGVNQLGNSGADVEHYHSGGTFYLVVNSECKWKIQVKG